MLSQKSRPRLREVVDARVLYLHLFVDEMVDSKEFQLSVGTAYGYPRGEVYLVAVFSFFVGFLDVLFYLVNFRYNISKYFGGDTVVQMSQESGSKY